MKTIGTLLITLALIAGMVGCGDGAGDTVPGALVTEFGTGGVVTSNPTTAPDIAAGMAIDSSAMYVIGVDSSPGDYQWRIEKRSLADGSLVTGFGTSGVVTSNPSTGREDPSVASIDSTAIYVVGYDYSSGDYEWRIEKRVR